MLKIAFDKTYIHPLKKNHRFPMIKYELLPEQLVRKNICAEHSFFSPSLISKKDAILTHGENYYDHLVGLTLSKSDQRQIGFPLSEALVHRERTIAQGSIQNTHYALEYGISMNIAGGTHHAYKDQPGAFCMLNDQAVAANYLIENKLAQRVMIVDLDVHQGNGTASIFENNPSVFTLSFHGQKNYPFRKQKSDCDVGFEDGTTDAGYLRELKNKLPKLVDRFEPDFIFYLAGVDVLKNDKLGRLGMTIEGTLRTGIPSTLDEFHDYSVEWEGSDLVYRLDGVEVYRNQGEGDRYPEAMFAILNYAKITDSPMTGEWVMEVDWVKHEKRKSFRN